MIRKVDRAWFEVWGHEQAQNAILKWLLAFVLAVCAIQAFAIGMLTLRSPSIISAGEMETSIRPVGAPSENVIQAEAKRVAERFLQVHHTWTSSNIEAQYQIAEQLVAQEFAASFRKANANQISIARSKRLSQQLFINSSEISWPDKTIKVSARRFLEVEDLTVASKMDFRVKFDLGPRTKSNPEGVYIVSEDLVETGKEAK